MSSNNLSVKRIASLNAHSGGVYAIKEYSENEIFTASSDKFITRWSLDNFENKSFAVQLPAQVYAIVYLKSKNYLIAGTFVGQIHIINLNTASEEKILENHKAAIFDIQYIETKNLIIVSSADGSISMIDSTNFNTLKVIKLCNFTIDALDK